MSSYISSSTGLFSKMVSIYIHFVFYRKEKTLEYSHLEKRSDVIDHLMYPQVL